MGPQDLTSFVAYLPGFYNYFGLSDCLYLTCLKYEFWWQLRPKVQRYNRARGAVFKARGPVTTSFELGRARRGGGGEQILLFSLESLRSHVYKFQTAKKYLSPAEPDCTRRIRQ